MRGLMVLVSLLCVDVLHVPQLGPACRMARRVQLQRLLCGMTQQQFGVYSCIITLQCNGVGQMNSEYRVTILGL
jgi:hypothetical protein